MNPTFGIDDRRFQGLEAFFPRRSHQRLSEAFRRLFFHETGLKGLSQKSLGIPEQLQGLG